MGLGAEPRATFSANCYPHFRVLAGTMIPIARFMLASLASAVSALLLLAITMPLVISANANLVGQEIIGATLVGILAVIPFVLIFGGIIALPVAALAGGLMLGVQKKRGIPLTQSVWLAAGAICGLIVSLFLGGYDPFVQRLVTAVWLAACGALGAWVFQRVMQLWR